MTAVVARVQALFAALALAVSLALPASAALAAPGVKDSATVAMRTGELTERDVAASNEKVRMAYSDLAAMWSHGFAQMHERFVVPRLLRYRGAARSTCGVMQPNNAAYCPLENAIYYDEVFVAAQAKQAALELGTDGDMAGIGVIAHEMGHAVAIQFGVDPPSAYENEAAADCLAGAFAQRRPQWLAREGRRGRGVLRHGRCRRSDSELTGNRRVDRVILRRASVMGRDEGTADGRSVQGWREAGRALRS
jgi:predicted metalloprotease